MKPRRLLLSLLALVVIGAIAYLIGQHRECRRVQRSGWRVVEHPCWPASAWSECHV